MLPSAPVGWKRRFWSYKARSQTPERVNATPKAPDVLHSTDNALTPTDIFSECLQTPASAGVTCLVTTQPVNNRRFSLGRFSSFPDSVGVPGWILGMG